MAVACVEIGRRLPSRAVDAFGLVLGALALARVWALDWQNHVLQRTVWWFASATVNYWALLALVAIAATQVSAWRLRVNERGKGHGLCVLLTFLSAAQWVALVSARCEGLTVTVLLLLGATMLLAASVIRPQHGHRSAGLSVLGLAAVQWLLVAAARLLHGMRWASTAAFFNGRMAVALAIFGCMYGAWRIHPARLGRRANGQAAESRAALAVPGQGLLIVGLLFLLAALSFEVERAVAAGEVLQSGTGRPVWPALQLRVLWWTLLWSAGGLAAVVWGRVCKLDQMFNAGWILWMCTCLVWLSLGTVAWRLGAAATPCKVVLNIEFGAGLGLLGMFLVAAWLSRSIIGQPLGAMASARDTIRLSQGLATAIGLWLGCLEIDRFFTTAPAMWRDPAMARQTALSVYLGVYGIAVIAAGFWKRSAAARYGGLAILAGTLFKVMLIDLTSVRYAYRVLSLLAVGLLFVATSIAYSRLAPRLTRYRHMPPTQPADE